MKLFVDFVLVAGLLISALILFVLFKSRRKQLPKYILIVFFSFLLLVALNAYAKLHDLRILYLLTTLFDDVVIVLVGPLLYLYIKSLFLDPKKLIWNNLIHFVPVLLQFSLITLPVFLSDVLDRPVLPYVETLTKNIPIVIVFCDLYLINYLALSLRLFSKYRNAMKINFSELSGKDFGWVRNMLVGALLVIVFDLFMLLLELSSDWFDSNRNIDFTVVAMVIFIGYLGYFGTNQSKVLLPAFLIREELLKKEPKSKTNHLSSLDEKAMEKLKSELEMILLSEKPYLDEDLTLGKLAQMMQTTDKKLSTLLNQYMHTNFYDFINKYRVEAVKEKLNSGQYDNLTLLGIAYESGFKSKTSFNRIFKKETGLSPSEYKKKY